MTLDVGLDKILVILVIALFLVGPDRLPRYAEGLAKLVKRGAEIARGAKDRMSDEMGPEFQDTDWRKLDPRQYDPRRIIADALFEEPGTAALSSAAGAAAAHTAVQTPPTRLAGERPPFDDEAT